MESILHTRLNLKDDLAERERSIAQRYWLVKDGSFVEKPSEIAKSLNLTNREVYKIAKDSGYLEISNYCFNCKIFYNHKVDNQTNARILLSLSWTCFKCRVELENNKIQNERNEIDRTLDKRNRKFEYAAENKVWSKFNSVELGLILRMLDYKSTNDIIWKVIQVGDIKNNWRTLYKADNFGLSDLVKDSRNYIEDIFFLDNLKDEIIRFRKFSNDGNSQEDSNNKTHANSLKSLHNELGFRLVKNPRRKSDEDALYYNDIYFDRDIIIKANRLYTYSVWPRENGDKWISITPSDNILKSTNVIRHNGPLHIGDIIKKLKY